MNIHSISLEKDCAVTVGEDAYVDCAGVDFHYKGEFNIRGLAIDSKGRVEFSIANHSDADDTVWLPIEGVEF
tara:strand:- start:259 stop:474 length:216 start_codon:yes stop_codon:yes gene_type:complete